MQFKGSVRAPGDKDPGVRVVLEIDEYHLEIRRDSELIGRYYLAEVEVARDIAERFILFLGDDEVEFLADDALQFAYGGVTAMQDGWLSAQKRKRRHRRAAEDAARRKDGEPPLEVETPMVRPLHVSDSDTIRSRRRQAGAKTTAPVDLVRAAPVVEPTPIAEAPAETRTERRERKEAASVEAAPPTAPEAVPKVAAFKRGDSLTPDPVAKSKETKPRAPSKPAAETARKTKGGKDSSVSIAARLGESAPKVPTTDRVGVGEVAPAAATDTSLAARRKKITADARPKDADDLGRVRVPEPVSRPGAYSPPQRRADATSTLIKQVRAGIEVDPDAEVRFAQEGHHPSETSTGLLSKLRRQPKLPDDHVHKFKASGSSVGLVRRVCIECAYVSIGNDDDD